MELILALILATATGTPVTGPTGVELEWLLDTGVQLPGTTEPWFFNGAPPVPCGDGVLIEALEDTRPIRVWAYHVTPAGVEVAVDEETRIPGTSFRLEGVSDLRCIGTNRYVLLIRGEPASQLTTSAFEWRPGGQFSLIQPGGVTIMGRDFGPLQDLGGNSGGIGILASLEPAFNGKALLVKFFGRDPILVADEQVFLPGQTIPVSGFSSFPRMQGSSLVFRALTFPFIGLYRWSEDQGISLLVDHQTPVPGFPGTFVGAGFFTVLSDGIAFAAGFSGGTGIFLYGNNEEIVPLVLPGDLTEGGETIVEAYTPRGEGNLFSFFGTTVETPLESLFARLPNGRVRRILGVGDVIDGRTIIQVGGAADSRSVAIRVDRTGPELTTSLYRATFVSPTVNAITEVPTLSTVGAIALAILTVLAGLWGIRRMG